MLKEILVSAALTLGQTPTIIDGDTVKIAGIAIRLTDFDSPELFHPKCPARARWHCKPGASCRRC
jgi:endonuclease YncB( thermonuclease family)